MMTINQIDQLKSDYAQMIVDDMDMNTLITFAVEAIEQNLKDYNMDELKGEIIDSMVKKLGRVLEASTNTYSNHTN